MYSLNRILVCFYYCYGAHRDLHVRTHSFPTRRSSDLLAECGLEKEVDLKVVDIDGNFQLGPFGIRLIPLAHSILEMSAVVIDTPYGRVFHTGDWKLDEEPILGVPATAAALTAVGDEGIDVLVCDSTNAFNPEASGSEGGLRQGQI